MYREGTNRRSKPRLKRNMPYDISRAINCARNPVYGNHSWDTVRDRQQFAAMNPQRKKR